MKKIIAITGATGRLGVPVVNALEKHFELRLLARDISKAKKLFPGKKIVEIDLETAGVAEVQRAVKGSWAVINLAGLVDLCASRQKLFSVNYQATAKTVKACEREGIPFFLHTSSISIYADSDKTIAEDSLLRPTTAYGQSKLAAENAVSNSSLQWIALRPGIIYGPHFQEGFLDLLKQMQNSRAAIIGKGDNYVPLVYEDDVARAFLQCLQLLKQGNKQLLCQAFNIVSQSEPTQLEAFNLLAKTFHLSKVRKKVSLSFALATSTLYSLYCNLRGKRSAFPPEYVELLARNRIYDVNKARKMLKFTASTPLEKGLLNIKRSWANI